MSLRTTLESTIPEETIRVARAAFPKGNVFMQMRDTLGLLYTKAQRLSSPQRRSACAGGGDGT